PDGEGPFGPGGASRALPCTLLTMKLYHTMIRVKDLDQTLAFYTEFLGLEEVKRSAIGDEATLVFLSDPDRNYFIELTYNHDGRAYELGDQFGHLAFVTEDLEAFVERVEGEGWWYRRSKPGNSSKYIFIKDPNGYDVEILQAR
ncbi:MAG: VOC family protein, partial [Planctomycetota bacterium]